MANSNGSPTSESSKAFPVGGTAIVHLVRDRRYEEALARLHLLAADHPHDRSVHASIRAISDRLITVYAGALGGMDAILAPGRSIGSTDSERTVVALVDGARTVGDVARASPLGRLETLRILARVFPAARGPAGRGTSAGRRSTLEFHGQGRSQRSTPPRSGFAAEDESARELSELSRATEVERTLRALKATSAIEAAALLSNDGSMIASALPAHFDARRVAATSATFRSLGVRAARALERGDVEEVLVKGHGGYAIMMASGADEILLCLAASASQLGLVLHDMRRALKAIALHRSAK